MKLDKPSGAVISPCQKYRYSLWRVWDKDKPVVMFLCLNPSTADEFKNDRTLNKCISFAKTLGFGGLVLGNLFAYRATQVTDMKKQKDPVGPENDMYLKKMEKISDYTICAWGNDGSHLSRAYDVVDFLEKCYYLKLTKSGHPSHPLYLPASLKPQKFNGFNK